MSAANRLERVDTAATEISEMMISSDSHIMEPYDLWVRRMPASLRDRAPRFEPSPTSDNKPGGFDPKERVREMAADGVSGEVLYPTLGLRIFGTAEDPALQQACFEVLNDYMAEYCSVAPDRLWGIGSVACYDVSAAVKEMERCKRMGLRGVMIWQVPPKEIPFTSTHYEDFWAAAEDLEMPVSLHILTGFNYSRRLAAASPLEAYRNSTNEKLHNVMDTVFDLVFFGALQRHPALKIVLVENEIGWIPFILHQWDRYVARRKNTTRPIALEEPPSFYFNRQVYSTFFNDPPGAYLLDTWGEDNCMWSSDYPHGNSTWPNSRQVVARDLGKLSAEARRKVLWRNVVQLYKLPLPSPLEAPK